MLLSAVAGISYAAYDRHDKKKKEKERQRVDLITQNVTEPECCEELPLIPIMDDLMVHKRIILANLITGMYERASEKPNYSQRWEAHHYELVPLEYILTRDDLQRCQHYLEKEEKYKYFGVLRRRNTEFASAVAPEWVVAIRGTKPKNLHDLRNDMKIALERLHTSSTVELLKIVVSRLVKHVGHGSKVAVTGHSLGASTAMVVARGLVLEGHLVDSHFFNPPFATISAMARKWVHKFFAPVLALTKGTRRIRDKLCKLEVGISMAFNLILDGGERMKQQYAEYIALGKWSPYLYLNENDPICQMYVSHFSKRQSKARLHENIDTWYSLGSALLKATLGDAETFHLMPRAVCCIAQTSRHRPISAHSLDNWTRHDVPLVIKVPNFAVEVDQETKQLTVNVGGDGVEEDPSADDAYKEINEEGNWFREGGDWFRGLDDEIHGHGDWQRQSQQESDLQHALPTGSKELQGSDHLPSLRESEDLQHILAANFLSSLQEKKKLLDRLGTQLMSSLPQSRKLKVDFLNSDLLSSLPERSIVQGFMGADHGRPAVPSILESRNLQGSPGAPSHLSSLPERRQVQGFMGVNHDRLAVPSLLKTRKLQGPAGPA